MTDARYQRVSALFIQAAAMPAAARAAFLERACGDDRELLRDVRRLLQHVDDRDFLSEASLKTHRSKLEEAFGPVDEPAPRPGGLDRIGPYEVIGSLGSGGSGEVLRVRDPGGGPDLALKLLLTTAAGRITSRRFSREIEILRGLRHPGIVRILDVGRFDDPLTGTGSPYFVMELVEGEPIDVHARRAGLDRTARIALVARVCDAVAEAHRHGIHHRDLKPANVLVQADGQPKVLDFGSAAMRHLEEDESQLTEPGHVLGTLEYMSPEQLTGHSRSASAPADVYALGVLLYEILAGRRPYELEGLRYEQKMHVMVHEAPRPLADAVPDCPAELAGLVEEALARSPQRRPRDAAALRDRLQALL